MYMEYCIWKNVMYILVFISKQYVSQVITLRLIFLFIWASCEAISVHSKPIRGK